MGMNWRRAPPAFRAVRLLRRTRKTSTSDRARTRRRNTVTFRVVRKFDRVEVAGVERNWGQSMQSDSSSAISRAYSNRRAINSTRSAIHVLRAWRCRVDWRIEHRLVGGELAASNRAASPCEHAWSRGCGCNETRCDDIGRGRTFANVVGDVTRAEHCGALVCVASSSGPMRRARSPAAAQKV